MKKLFKTIVSFIILIVLVGLPTITHIVYNKTFNLYFKTPSFASKSVLDYPNLNVKNDTFLNNKGLSLAAYHYYQDFDSYKGVIVLSHGFGGGGHISYLDIINEFTLDGYKVFTYDATGNDNSPGKVGGMPQGRIDLDYALNYLETKEEYQDLPIFLFGHSWGANNVLSVLPLHKEVKGVIELAGFDEVSDMIIQEGTKMAGKTSSKVMAFYTRLLENFKFKEYSKLSGSRGLKESICPIMLVHSKDDEMVEITRGFDKFYQAFSNEDRLEFVRLKDKGHEDIYYSYDAINYKHTLKEKYDELGQKEITYYEYLDSNLDKEKAYDLDYQMVNKFINFYDEIVKSLEE